LGDRVGDPSFGDWDGFVAWLEEDPANLAAYEAALDIDTWAVSLLGEATHAVNDDAPIADHEAVRPRRRPLYWATGLAAVAAAVIALVLFWPGLSGGSIDWVATAPGQHRMIALEDGTRIVMNGGTRLGMRTSGTGRQVELAQGEALFQVRHDSEHPFAVVVGDTRLVDAGTLFNVVRDGGALRVGVAEGEVIYQPGTDQIALRAGDTLARTSAAAAPVVSHVDPVTIGDWRSGSLQYDDAMLDRVAQDLSRNLGRPITAGTDVANQRFTGTLNLAGTPQEVLARASPLLGVTLSPEGDGWTMHRDDGAHR
jgi:transmembrane sensor